MAARASFEEHQGEVRLVLTADSPDELFAAAAEALGTLEAAGIARLEERRSHRIALVAGDPASLLVDWLNELVYRAETGSWVPDQAAVTFAAPASLSATVEGPVLAAPPSLVKAATLHRARVTQAGDTWTAEVILDV